ncbi:MAG TPA: ubiquinone/menaquinone biosynthesis methyltransferase, partial [Lacipirellulaceae bacterium]|nr:ubiquinone/menaquinone biosynthesis methyltransferase [Lacipirellulaceae bacterium]
MPVDKSSDRVRRMFGQIARRYDFLNHLLSLGIDHYWRWRTVRLVPPSGSLPILDVCTGTGDLALAYDRAARGSTPILGADFCHEMLVIAREKAGRAGANSRITFVEADAQDLPVPGDAFQIVCVAFGLRNVADTNRGLTEMTRVCAPGGHLAVLEFTTPTWQPFKSIYGWYFRHALPRIGQL